MSETCLEYPYSHDGYIWLWRDLIEKADKIGLGRDARSFAPPIGASLYELRKACDRVEKLLQVGAETE